MKDQRCIGIGIQFARLSAGIVGFTDEITIEIDSGDPGGDKGEFEEHMLNALRGWYDGAKVSLGLPIKLIRPLPLSLWK